LVPAWSRVGSWAGRRRAGSGSRGGGDPAPGASPRPRSPAWSAARLRPPPRRTSCSAAWRRRRSGRSRRWSTARSPMHFVAVYAYGV